MNSRHDFAAAPTIVLSLAIFAACGLFVWSVLGKLAELVTKLPTLR